MTTVTLPVRPCHRAIRFARTTRCGPWRGGRRDLPGLVLDGPMMDPPVYCQWTARLPRSMHGDEPGGRCHLGGAANGGAVQLRRRTSPTSMSHGGHQMAAQAMGPTYAGGTQPIVKDGYAVLYLPDVCNRELIAQGEAPVFYYVPNQVRMARKEGPDKGDYLFNLVRFAGTGGEGVVGGAGEVAGGVLTFSTTGALPESTRQQAEAEITAQFANSNDAFWGLLGSAKPPMFRPAII